MLLYDQRTFIDILKNQSPNVNSYRKVLQTCSKAARHVGKRKYNLNGISTALRRHFRRKLFPLAFLRFLDYNYWPVRDVELALRDAANVHTGKKKPLGCLNLIVLACVTARENSLLMLTAVLHWCQQLPFKW